MCRLCSRWLCFAAFLAAILVLGSASEKIIRGPSDQEPVEGSSLTVTCSSDDGAFVVWYREGTLIPHNSPDFIQTSSHFGSTSTLSIVSAHHSLHTGWYECVVVFPDSSTAVTSFNITVQYIDTNIGIQFEASSNCSSGHLLSLGCRLRLECLPPGGYPQSVAVAWYRSGQPLGETFDVVFLEAMRVMVVDSVTYADSGNYQCWASNGLGFTRKSMLINITVQGVGDRELSFVGNATDEEVTVVEGAVLILHCSVKDAVGGVVFQWQTDRDGGGVVSLEDGTARTIITSSANSSSLVIHQTSVLDEGHYYCTASDHLSGIRKRFTICINVPRTILHWPPAVVKSFEGDSIRFVCVASGRPVPVVIWLFQSTPVSQELSSSVQDLGNGSLLIPVLQKRHAGTYRCRLKEEPLDMHTVTLTVLTRSQPSSSSSSSSSSSLLLTPSLMPAGNSTNHHTTLFTIGPFSPTVSILLIVLGGLGSLLLCTGILCFCCCYGGTVLGRRPYAEEQYIQSPVDHSNNLTAKGCTYIGGGGGGGGRQMVTSSRERVPLAQVPVMEEQATIPHERIVHVV